jgi:hypothetical protein
MNAQRKSDQPADDEHVEDLSLDHAETKDVKGGGLLANSLANTTKSVGDALSTAARKQ